jgi:hypothetical protein
VSRGRKVERHACSVIGTWQYREMESSCASAPPAREPENIEAARKAREQETNASDPLTAPKARKGRETNVPCPRKTESMGARETKVPEKETAAVRRDGEPLTSAAKKRQKEAAADRHQAAAGERPPSSAREGIGPVPLSATDPGRKLRDVVGTDRPQLTTAKADRVEASRGNSRLNCDPAARLCLEATSALARDLTAGTDCLSPLAVRWIIQVADEDVKGSLTAVCRLDRELRERVACRGRPRVRRGAASACRDRPGACRDTAGVYKNKASRYNTQEDTFSGDGRSRPSPAFRAGSRCDCSRCRSYETCGKHGGVDISTEPCRHACTVKKAFLF